jgi:hypothetical protein
MGGTRIWGSGADLSVPGPGGGVHGDQTQLRGQAMARSVAPNAATSRAVLSLSDQEFLPPIGQWRRPRTPKAKPSPARPISRLAAKMHDVTRFHTCVERTSGSSDRLDRCKPLAVRRVGVDLPWMAARRGTRPRSSRAGSVQAECDYSEQCRFRAAGW